MSETLNKIIRCNSEVQSSLNSALTAERTELFNRRKGQVEAGDIHRKESSNFLKVLNTMQLNLHNDLAYVSAALLQKHNFESVICQYRNYCFPLSFLKRLVEWIKAEKLRIDNHKNFSETSEHLKNRIAKIGGMIEMSKHTQGRQ